MPFAGLAKYTSHNHAFHVSVHSDSIKNRIPETVSKQKWKIPVMLNRLPGVMSVRTVGCLLYEGLFDAQRFLLFARIGSWLEPTVLEENQNGLSLP